MKTNDLPDNPYLLLTPGPLSTSKTVKAAMLRDWCTWDDDYNLHVVEEIRKRLVAMATAKTDNYSSVLMQGSGTFCVESVLGTVVPDNGKVLIIANGAYGARMIKIATVLRIPYRAYILPETEVPQTDEFTHILESDESITHVAMVHCETTTGILNPVRQLAAIAKARHKVMIVDAMSSFGGLVMDVDDWGIDYLISSANKCIQGVPGFGFVIARKSDLTLCAGQARSHALDLYDQWYTMEQGKGKWRFTSPTHVVRAFLQALLELEEEGGVLARQTRYIQNQRLLVRGMRRLGFSTLLPDNLHSPMITAFESPEIDAFDFGTFYRALKVHGFIIYPGKVAQSNTFRIGTIGEVSISDIEGLLAAVRDCISW